MMSDFFKSKPVKLVAILLFCRPPDTRVPLFSQFDISLSYFKINLIFISFLFLPFFRVSISAVLSYRPWRDRQTECNDEKK